MVLADWTDSYTTQNFKLDRIAPLSDRVSAFFLDVLLLGPAYSLIFAGLFRKLEFRYFISPQSTELWILVLAAVLAISVSTVVLQTVSLYLWQTTPGKYFFKLKVVSVVSRDLSFTQCFLRSGLWCFEFLLMGLPFLEVLGHPQRRPLHDRASDTMVVSLKKLRGQGPSVIETRFIQQVLLGTVGMFLLWATVGMLKLYRLADQGAFKLAELESEQYLCPNMSAIHVEGASRLDHALALYLTDSISEDCLEAESDFAFWSNQNSQKSWAHLAKAFIYKQDQGQSDLYLKNVCQADNQGSACQIANLITGKSNKNPNDSLTAQILEIREYQKLGNYSSVLKGLKQLPPAGGFRDYVQSETIKYLWQMKKASLAWGAYDAVHEFLESPWREDLSGWLCLEQLDQACENRNYQSCEDLSASIQTTGYQHLSETAVLAVVRQRECKRTSEPSLLNFHEELSENADLRDLVAAITQDSNLSKSARLTILRRLAFSSIHSNDNVLRQQAMIALASLTTDPEDFNKMKSQLAGVPESAWIAQKLAKYIGGIVGGKERLPASEDKETLKDGL